eukprot:6245352-Prymnesium_polylepis.2
MRAKVQFGAPGGQTLQGRGLGRRPCSDLWSCAHGNIAVWKKGSSRHCYNGHGYEGRAGAAAGARCDAQVRPSTAAVPAVVARAAFFGPCCCRYQATIDLGRNVLLIGGEAVPFIEGDDRRR